MDNTLTYCGADCGSCPSREECSGCVASCGSPFGGRCVAAEYIRRSGISAYEQFRQMLTDEVNDLLSALELDRVERLYELAGRYVNLEYTMPGGQQVKLLNDSNIYLGAQISFANLGICYGVVADAGFILICSYSVDGSEPELVLYKRR